MTGPKHVQIQSIKTDITVNLIDAPLTSTSSGLIRPRCLVIEERGEKVRVKVTGPIDYNDRSWRSSYFNGIGYDEYPSVPPWITVVLEEAWRKLDDN